MAKLLSGTRIYGNLVIDTWANAASANISGTTTSTSTTTGALVVAGGAGIAGNLFVGSNASSLLSSSMNGISLQGQLQPYTLQGSDGTVTSTVLTLPSAFAIAALASTGNVARSYISKSNSTNDLQIGAIYTAYQGNVVLNAGTGATSGIRIITGTTANYVSTFDNAGNLTVAGNTNINGGQLTVGNIVATGNVSISGNLSITGNITSVNYETVTNTEYVTTLVATTVNAASANISGTTTSTSTTTGALVVAGGVGIAGNLSIGGNITTSTSLIPSGNVLSLGGNVSLDVLRIYSNNSVTSDYYNTTFASPQFALVPPQNNYGAAIVQLGQNPRISSLGVDGIYVTTNGTLGYTGTTQLKIVHTGSAVNYTEITGGTTGNGPTIRAQGETNVELNLVSRGTSGINLRTGANTATQFRVGDTSGAVNYLQVTGGATGTAPSITATGSDSSVGLTISTKNTLPIVFGGAGGTHFIINPTYNIAGAAPVINQLQVQGGFAGNVATLSAQGNDTNVSMLLQPKGTTSNLAIVANSAVVLSSGTGAISAIRYNALGSGYGTQPTITISAPTTAGGVTATANASIYFGGGTVVSGGTGYSVGDVLTVVGGSYSSQGQINVTGNSGGVITSVTVTNGGAYYSFPANAVSVTGGTGSGATFNLLPGGVNSYNLLSGGSGYVEPPTVTISGGGGSGATALARIGNIPAIRSLASNLDFYTSSGQILRLTDSTNLAVNYWQIGSAASGVQVSLSAVGGDAAIGTNFTTKGTGAHVFSTNSFGSVGLVVTHTASAVNYPQITGATTGNGPVLFVQGSDSNIELNLQSKGTGGINLRTGASTATQFRVGDTAGAVNYVQVSGATSGGSPTIVAAGSDANASLAISSKGSSQLYLSAGSSGGAVRISTNNSEQLTVSGPASAVNRIALKGATTGTSPLFAVAGSDTNINFEYGTIGSGAHNFYTFDRNAGSSNLQMSVSHTGSAVNYIQVTGGATGTGPTLSAQGSDTNVYLNLVGKGGGGVSTLYYHNIGSYYTNYLSVSGTNSGAPTIQALSFTNASVDISFVPKGTGNVTTASPLTVTNANVSTSISTGALVVQGGAGIVGDVNIGANLTYGAVPILESSRTVTGIGTAPVAIDWFSNISYRTGKYVVSTADVTNSWYQSTEIILVQDGNVSTITTYGAISSSGNTRMTFSSNIMSGNVILWGTGVSANNTIKLVRTLIPV